MTRLAAYTENKIATQSGGKIVVMLYEGAIRFLKQSVSQIEAQDWKGKNDSIQKAQAIIDELRAALNKDAGGEVAQNLWKLYDFMYRRLIEANIRKDISRINEVIALLEDLLDGWREIAE
ncbi:MAG: flagellar export chaperone FliS [Planctomycetaceae bacterium]|nr:flagellar export chaperone FliS [Planctomycetaceae bacterium]